MKEGWAEEKVKRFYPQCREKMVLRSIASYATPGGLRIWVSIRTLANDTGLSMRTVRRYIKTLVNRGDLVTWCDVDRSRDSNFYFVPMCQETVPELEARTGIGRNQLKLPIVSRDVGMKIVPAQAVPSRGVPTPVRDSCPSGKGNLTHPQGQPVPVNRTIQNTMEHLKGNQKGKKEVYSRVPDSEMSPETRKMLDDLLAGLDSRHEQERLAPKGSGSRLREELLGSMSESDRQEYDRLRRSTNVNAAVFEEVRRELQAEG